MAYQITEKDFNRYRISKSAIEAVLPALQDTFDTLWKNDFPEQPWTNNKDSVDIFERKVQDACKERAASRSDSQKEKQKINRILADLKKDESWYECHWDISMLAKVLVDCKLFDLDAISVELSDHIKGITNIRNKMAHTTAFGIEKQEFKDTMKSLKTHLEGLRCVISESVDHHLHTLKQLKYEDMPTSIYQLKDMCHEIENMKITLKWCQEKENRLLDREVFQKEKHDLETKLNTQEHEIQRLKNVIVQLENNQVNLEERLNESQKNQVYLEERLNQSEIIIKQKIAALTASMNNQQKIDAPAVSMNNQQKSDALAVSMNNKQSNSQMDSSCWCVKKAKKICPCFFKWLSNKH